jgi:predicted alpha/beta-hydrolase family hydrolase
MGEPAPLSTLRDGPADAALAVLLAHGAGAPMDSPFLARAATLLAGHGIEVVRFEFAYMAARRRGERRPPDRRPALEARWSDALAAAGRPARECVLAGKSLGARVATYVADALGARAVVCLGYPFRPPGGTSVGRVEHLADLRTPTLLVQGTRDPYGPPSEVAGYRLSPAVRVHWVAGADHGLALPAAERRAGRDGLVEAVDAAVAFLRAL